jgi:hypothetical protein
MSKHKQVHQYDLKTLRHLATYETVTEAAAAVAGELQHTKASTIVSSINRSAHDKTATSYGYYWSYERADVYPGRMSTRGKGQPRGEARVDQEGREITPGRPKKPMLITIDGVDHRVESQVDAAKLLQSLGYARAKGSMFSSGRKGALTKKTTVYGHQFRFLEDAV